LAGQLSAAQLLVHSDVRSVSTPWGPVSPDLSPVTVGKQLTVAIFVQYLTPEDITRLTADLQTLYKGVATPLRLAIVQGDSMKVAGPFQNRRELTAALHEIMPDATAQPDPNAVRAFQRIGSLIPELGSDWSSAILAGRFPAIFPELAAYTSAWLIELCTKQRLRLTYWPSDDASNSPLLAVSKATGTEPLVDGIASAFRSLESDVSAEATWKVPALAAGFDLYEARLSGESGPFLTVPILRTGGTAPPPDLEAFKRLLDLKGEAQTLAAVEKATADRQTRFRDLVNQILTVNANEEAILRGAAAFWIRHADPKSAIPFLERLTQAHPTEAELFASLGLAKYDSGSLDEAAAPLEKARSLGVKTVRVSESSARIDLAHKDDQGALPLLDEALLLDASRQDLWFIRADLEQRLGDTTQVAVSIERAIALGGDHLDRQTALIEAYFKLEQPDSARKHIQAVVPKLPPDAQLLCTYARFEERLKDDDAALRLWRLAIERDRTLEAAHVRIEEILTGRKALDEALVALDDGLTAIPASERLNIAKGDLLRTQGRFYAARVHLRQAALAIPLSNAVLGNLASVNDVGGKGAAQSYRLWAESLDPKTFSVSRGQACKRGLEVAIRDDEAASIGWFRDCLGSAAVKTAVEDPANTGVWIKGGAAALAFAADSKTSASDGRFLVDFARTALMGPSSGGRVNATLGPVVRDHFRRLAELSAFGVKKSDSVVVLTLDPTTKTGRKQVEQIAALIGWNIHTDKGKLKLEPAQKKGKARNQETASALELDEVGMQSALEAGRAFQFEIRSERVPVILDDATWRTVYDASKFPGGLPEALATDILLARAYAAFGQLDPRTARVVAESVGLKSIVEKHSAPLQRYGAAIAVGVRGVSVPGGDPAAALWRELASTDPADSRAFVKTLLLKDDGAMLAYFATLSELDFQHQRFFTKSTARLRRFYDLFRELNQAHAAQSLRYGSAFSDLLSEIPLTTEDAIDFPGSPEVWMLVKGQSASTQRTAKLLRKLKTTAAPDVEDEILIRLARTKYKSESGIHTEVENFIAVARIDAHRDEPLDEASALLLAQHYPRYNGGYGYFSSLTGLRYKQFVAFFDVLEKLQSRPAFDQNAALAYLNGVTALVALAQRSQSVTAEQGAALLGRAMDRFAAATSAEAWTAGGLDAAQDLLSTAKMEGDADSALMRVLRGKDIEAPAEQRYRQILDLQKSPSLATLLDLYRAAGALARNQDPTAAARTIDEKTAALPELALSKTLKIKDDSKKFLAEFHTAKLRETSAQILKVTAKKKLKASDLAPLSAHLLAELSPMVRLALAGSVYASYLDPEDTLVSEDPLFLRKHRFAALESSAQHPLLAPTDLKLASDSGESFLAGSFAGFSYAAGRVSVQGGQLAAGAALEVGVAQIASLRSTPWWRLNESDFRLINLKQLAAREWISNIAGQPALEVALRESTAGLLSLNRQTELLAAASVGDWSRVWSTVTLSDLYFIGDEFLQRFEKDPWPSPVFRELRHVSATNDGQRLALIGAVAPTIDGCEEPHLRRLPPFEQFEPLLIPLKLAERSAELKLSLALRADRDGITPAGLEALAEPLARRVLGQLKLSDPRDWRSVERMFRSVENTSLTEPAK
jgi:hypothetical protein